MTSTIVFLFIQIEKKKKACHQDSDFCAKEKRTLFTILFFFNLMYLIRAFWDFSQYGMIYKPDNSNLLQFYLTETVLLSLPDFITIAALLALHRKNFLSPSKCPIEAETTCCQSSVSVLLIAVDSQNQEPSVTYTPSPIFQSGKNSLSPTQSNVIQK